MAAIVLDYKKLSSDDRIAVWGSLSGSASGIQEVSEPTEDELNNTGGASGMIQLSQAISWSDTELPGLRASEESNEPSLADPANYVEFGPSNYDATLSMFFPKNYDDPSNPLSVAYDLLDMTDWRIVDFAVRIDGDKPALAPAEDGDYVTVTRQRSLTEARPYNFDESARRTLGFSGTGGFAHYTVVGDHTLTTDSTGPTTVGDKGRIVVKVQDRDYTNALHFTSSDPSVVEVGPGGYYTAVGAGSFTITVRDEAAGTSTTVTGTVA